jgi:hypothetical protein
MKNVRILLVTIITSIVVSAFSQFPEKALEVPIKYITPQEDVSLTNSMERRPGSYWVVFSDKKGNKTYENKMGSKVKQTIGFMDNFYVAEETDDRVHIIKDPNYKEGFSSSAEDYGWIDKENLLLWDHCLITKTGKINLKAMVLNTVESLKKDKIKKGDEEKVKYYYDNQLTTETSRSSKIYEILYVYKVKGDAMLLGKNYTTDAYHAGDEIFGWVSSRKVTPWDHRVAVEPNWDKEAALERKQKNKPTTFFIDVGRAKKYGEGGVLNKKGIIWDKDSYQERNIGDWRRFPLLHYDKKTGIIKAGVMGELRTVLNKQDTIGQLTLADIQRKYNDLRALQRNVNIVFVVDGTTSMQPYYAALSKAIGVSMDKLKKSYTKNTLRFGAVVYRDYAERDMITQVKKLTSNYQEVSRWLTSIRATDRFDKDKPEAVNYGLMTALRSVGLQQNETNVIILVGDAANHHRDDPSQVDKDDVVNLLYRYDCNFLAFQVNKESHPTYDEFEPQIKDIILSTANKKYKQNQVLTQQLGINVPPPRFISVGTNKYMLDTTTIIGSVVLAKRGDPLRPLQLQKEIDKVILFSSKLTDRKLRILEAFIAEGESFSGALAGANNTDYYNNSSDDDMLSKNSYAPAIIDFLRKMGVPESKLKILLEENYQLYFPAYSSMRVKGLEHPLYKQVLFMTLRELGDLLTKFDALADAFTASDQRQKLKEVWMELLQSHTGDDISRDQAENMTFEEINEKVFGLPGTSALLQVRLKDITDPSVVDDAKFYEYVQNIKKKRLELDKIYNNKNYEFGFYSYDTQYFWISQDLLP